MTNRKTDKPTLCPGRELFSRDPVQYGNAFIVDEAQYEEFGTVYRVVRDDLSVDYCAAAEIVDKYVPGRVINVQATILQRLDNLRHLARSLKLGGSK